MADSTTATVVRTRSTVCSREMTRARSRGAAPNTSAVRAGVDSGAVNQSMNAEMPAWATRETHERSSAPSSRNHGRVSSMRLVAAVVSSPRGPPEQGGLQRRGGGSGGSSRRRSGRYPTVMPMRRPTT